MIKKLSKAIEITPLLSLGFELMRKIMKHAVIISSLLTSFILMTCANQGYPPGGPEDKSPPFVRSTFPPPDSTNVSRDLMVIIEFSEPVIPRTAEESIFITPFSGDNLRFKWRHDRQLSISFADSLLALRTYVITIGAGAKDRRNNMMKNSFRLAFSTGPTLDSGKIEGRIFGEKVEGAQVWAYDLSQNAFPNPAELFPLYVTQVGKDGIYMLTNMALGTYRLFAVLDQNVNNLYDPNFDWLGITHRDIPLDSTNLSAAPLNFRLALRDTLAPRLESARAPDNRHVDLRFSEPMRTDFLSDPRTFSVISTEDTLKIVNASHERRNAALVHLTTSAQTAEKQYAVQVKNGLDLSGSSLISDSSRVEFVGSSIPDTVRPVYRTMAPKDSSINVVTDAKLEFFFSKAMNPETVVRHLVVADTLGDTSKGQFTWSDQSHIIFTPLSPYKSKTFYYVTLRVDSVFDFFGLPLADTLFQRRFTTVNVDTFSAISGQLDDEAPAAEGTFFLKASSADPKNPRIYEQTVEKVGKYLFKQMIPGKYVIELYRDEDHNGAYTLGEAFPFFPAERFYVYPDTIEIRSRWPDEGENIVFPR
ncbi:MAG: hypothetical protein EHM72_05655 [Calditrichaeota bacterium]|nr:MAG: hypothetical protein EHM72_05655 [Calditrichota bacterium]